MKRKRLFLLIPAIGLLGAMLFSSVHFISSMANAQNRNEMEFSDIYYTNEEIVIPDLKLDVDGQMIDGVKYVIYPNGRTYQKEAFTPVDMGYYTISYRASNVSKDFSIYVAQNKYYVTGEGSATWSAHPKTPSKESLVVTLGAGAVFHFDEIINLKELGPSRTVFSFYPVSAEVGSPDANTIKIRLTDVYDDSRYIQYEIDASRQGYSHGVVYMRVGGENQVPTGVEAALNRVHSGSIFGFPYNCNLYCCTKTMKPLTEREYISNRIGLFFDYANMMGLSLANENGENMICDLDDSKYFSEFWEGFTTGECKVSAWFENMLAPTGTICVTNIGGKILEDKILIDDAKPNLEIDDIFDSMPEAIINQKYRFFKASGSDQYSGDVGVNIRVYRDYYGSKIQVPCSDDGFIPNKLGKYYIEYSCIDYSHNESSKLYEIDCVNEKRDFNLSLVDGYATNGYVGEVISLANINIEGTIGPAIAKTIVTTPDGNEEEIEKTYTPSKAGKHVVTYVVSDFVGTIKSISYDLNVTVSEAPLINEEASLLRYYIAGYEYELPLINAIDFNKDGNPLVTSKIKIIDGGNENLLPDNKVTFASDSKYTRDVTIRYICENEKASNYKDYHVQVVTTSNDGFIHMEKYWAGEEIFASASSSEVNIASMASGSATFVNNLAANEFEMNFIFRGGANGFDVFNVYLTDSLNSEEKIKVAYYPAEEKPKVIVNDDTDFIFEGNGLFNNGNQFIQYNNSTHKIQTNGLVTIPVKRYMNGDKFEGFSSGSIYLTIEFVNPSNHSVALSLIDLNGQEMSSTKYDYIRPRALMDDEYGGAKSLNEVVTLCSAKAYDVLDPCPKISLSAYDSDNQYLKDINGQDIKDVKCDEPHKFKIERYGLYRVSYHIVDFDENGAYFTYVITVYDNIAPTITFNDKNPTTANVGETIKLVEPVVADNYTKSEDIKLIIYIVLPTGELVEVKNYSYTFTMAGKHTIRYMALDEELNISIVDFYVEVSEVK